MKVLITKFMKVSVSDDCIDDMLKFTDISTLEERMKGRKAIFADAVNYNGEWHRYMFVRQMNEPAEDALDKTKNEYSQFKKKVAPYDGSPYNHEQYTYRDIAVSPDGCTDEANTSRIYLWCFELKNQNQFKEITKFSNAIMKCASLK